MHADAPLALAHVQGAPYPLDEAVEIERIDQHRTIDLLRCAGESAEYEHAALLRLTGDELLGDEIHAILQ